MIKKFIILVFSTILVYSCDQFNTSKPVKDSITTKQVDTIEHVQSQETLKSNPNSHVHNESTYTDTTGLFVTIQNSFPKGGSYSDPAGNRFGYGIFWTRLINKSAFPLELTINFPADSFLISAQPNSYFKLFLPPDTMEFFKLPLLDYGATGLKSFMDAGLTNSTILQRTLSPKEEFLFYIGMLFRAPDNGPVRTGIVLREEELFYKVSIDKLIDSTFIGCGRIGLKKMLRHNL